MKFTIPNCLTLFRLFLVPVVVILTVSGNGLMALIFFVAAGITDLLDGYIARKTGTTTSFGQVADPLADKLMTVAVLGALYAKGNLPWHYLAIYAIKEGILFAGGIAVLAGKLSGKMEGVEVKAQFIGKVAAALAFSGIALSFFPEYVFPWNEALLLAGAAVGIATIAYYIHYAVKMKRK
jgi:cardiolipin synthase